MARPLADAPQTCRFTWSCAAALRGATHASVALHALGRRHADHRETVREHLARGREQRDARIALGRVVDENAFGIVERVEFSREFAQIERDRVRREFAGRMREHVRIFGELGDERERAFARQRREVDLRQCVELAAELALPVAENRRDACVRVLHVIHRVFVVFLQREVDVEHEFRVGLARDEEEAHGVAAAADGRFVELIRRDVAARAVHIGAARPFDQVAHGHVAARALGDLHFLAVAHDGDHLVQHVVGIARRNADAERLQARAHARDGAVVVRALDVDDLGEAAFPLGDVVCDVRQEVRVGAVGLAHHAVLVVAVVGRLEPQRAVLLVGLARGDQRLDGLLDAAFGVERRFEVVAVELHAERLQVEILLVAQVGDGEAADRFEVFRILRAGDGLAVLGRDGFAREVVAGDFGDVFAVVGGFGPARVARLQAARARLGGDGEIADLHARVVVVELAVHVVALRAEHVRDGVAERGLTAVADVQRTGGIGRDELDQHALAGFALRAAERGAFGEHGAEHGALGVDGQAQVDEAGTGHFGVGDQTGGGGQRLHGVDDLLGQRARIGAQRLGELHRDVAGDVAVRGDLRTLERDRGHDECGFGRALGGLRHLGDGVGEQSLQGVFLCGQHACCRSCAGSWVRGRPA
ncbi:hypothetical protein PT2222_10321 [Paraburkholderia tropica]